MDAGLVAVLILFVVFLIPILFYISGRAEDSKRNPPTKQYEAKNTVVYGVPGSGLANAPFSTGKIQAGTVGERKTALILDDFARRHTNVHVFHSLIWPRSYSKADIDHAVVCGNNVLLIDSKNWKAKGVYSFDFNGNITLDGNSYTYGQKLSILNARDSYLRFFKERMSRWQAINVTTAVVIHSNGSTANSKRYMYDNSVVIGDNLVSFLNDFRLETGLTQDNHKLLALMRSCLKNY